MNSKLRFLIAWPLLLLFPDITLAQFSAPVEKINYGTGFRYTEVVVSVNVPLISCFLGCGGRETTLRGLLWLPISGESKPPYKLVVSNHGSQDGGTRYAIGIPQNDSVPGLLLQRGYAVIFPARKGFNLNHLPKSDASADSHEAVSCQADMAPGLASAVSDVKAYLRVLSTRGDLDMTKILMTGGSRGGVIALALAAEEYPGVTGVINSSGGWMADTTSNGMHCSSSSFNFEFFRRFGEKIKVPVLSRYGGRDSYYDVSHIRTLLSYLGKNAPADFVIIPDAGHQLYMAAEFQIKLEKFLSLVDSLPKTVP